MKKFTFILVIAILSQAGTLFAQDTEQVTFEAVLSEVLNLNVLAGDAQAVTFDTPATYNLGVDDVGQTTITVESTTDWNLAVSAADLIDGAGASIPINNVGIWLQATGAHTIGGECSSTFTSLAASCGITVAAQTIIDNNGGNAGDATDNAFTINWTMGTMQGTMNGASIFDQLSDGTIGNTGTYNTTVNFTVTAE